MIVGIVGGIGAGKSTVRRLFADLGAETVDADALAHEALETPQVRARLRSWLGDPVFLPNGKVDRKVVANLVFSNADRLRELEALVHPVVIRRLEDLVKAHQERKMKSEILILDVPLLLSSPLRARCDEIVFVEASEGVRTARVADRGWAPEDIRRREILQTPLEEKKKLATVLIDNSASLDDTRRQVKDLYLRWTKDGEP